MTTGRAMAMSERRELPPAAIEARREYTNRLLCGFSLPLITVFELSDGEAFDLVCNEIREAYAGSVLYLKQYRYPTGCEGFFVIDLPICKAEQIFDRLQSFYGCFERCDVRLHHPQNKTN